MMKRNYLWMLLASMAFVGCSQNDDLPESNENQNGEKEVSYIAFSVNNTPSSRAAEDYADAEGNEATVSKAHFFFFNQNGEPFVVGNADPSASVTTNSTNYVSMAVSATADTDNNGNTESIVNAVVVLEKLTTEFPAQVVAVLNWDYTGESLTLADLKDKLVNAHNTTNGFIMSNSVYKNGTAVVDAVAINQSNFATTEGAAKTAAVGIHVERVAAKATLAVNTTDKQADTTTDTGYKNVGDATTPRHAYKTGVQIDTDDDPNTAATDVYAEILAWDLNTTINQSYLVKHLPDTDPTWTGWNDASNYRSYWAESALTNATFATSFAWSGLTNSIGASDYCLENTDANNTTKVLVKAQLVDASGTAQNVAQWYGKYYATNNLATAVAAALSEKLFTGTDGQTKTAITAAGIKLIAGYDKNKGTGTVSSDPHDYYRVYFGLADGTTPVYGSADANATALTDDQIAAIFDNLSPAKVWTSGATYYYVDIAHLAASSAKAVIRNHAYTVTIQGVKGLGTPVYGTEDTAPEIPEPVTPEDTETYLAAKINVLSWKLVSNDVVLGQ